MDAIWYMQHIIVLRSIWDENNGYEHLQPIVLVENQDSKEISEILDIYAKHFDEARANLRGYCVPAIRI